MSTVCGGRETVVHDVRIVRKACPHLTYPGLWCVVKKCGGGTTSASAFWRPIVTAFSIVSIITFQL